MTSKTPLQCGIKPSTIMIENIKRLFNESFLFYRQSGLIKSLKANETPILLQIFKYVIFGISVTLVHASVVYGLGYTINPAIGENIPKEIKLSRTIWNNIYAFLVSNSLAFWLNSKFLFKTGRHKKINELALFFLISGISFSLGLFAIDRIFTIIDSNKAIEHFANIAFIACSASVNFLCRKFLIFSN